LRIDCDVVEAALGAVLQTRLLQQQGSFRVVRG
jgi:hypothetical protein